MKFSRTSWIVFGVGLFVIAGITLYVVYQGQAGERQDASDRLAEAQAALPAAVSDKNDAESRLGQLEDELSQLQSDLVQMDAELAQAELALAQVKIMLPDSVESIEYGEKLFALVDSSNLVVTILNASEPIEVQIEGITYSTTTFTLEVRGEVANILNFISAAVADNDFKTAVLEPISMTIPELLTDTEKEGMTEEEIADLERPSAVINLTIYTYQGE
jgi:TolA-binding protein